MTEPSYPFKWLDDMPKNFGISCPAAQVYTKGGSTMYITQAERQSLTETRVTLDGKPAIILGARRDYATVAQIPDGLSYEWCWETVKRVVETKNGEFKS